MITKSNINFVIDKSKPEGVTDLNKDIFPNHFLALICGKPGSGKTSLLKFLLKSEDLLFKKFDYVFIVSPSFKEYASLYLPAGNYHPLMDFNWILKMINGVDAKEYSNVLFILDDVISDLHKNSHSKELMDFIFNRRHLLKNGMISIILTSQKYKTVPVNIRGNITMLFSFKLSKIDEKQIQEEIIFSDVDLNDVTKFVFTEENAFFIYRIDNNEYFKNFDKFNI